MESEIKLAELIGSLSHALDLTEGQPAGHCVRCCWIGMHVGREIGLDDEALWSLYYTLLLKDLGCSSNAARIFDGIGPCESRTAPRAMWPRSSPSVAPANGRSP